MVTIDEVLAAATDFKNKMNANPKIQKLLKIWNPLIHFATTDSGIKTTVNIKGGIVEEVKAGNNGDPDLVISFPTALELRDMLLGKLNPTAMYLSGDIRVKGHQADVIKLDAITMILWPE